MFVYSDEDKIDAAGRRSDPYFKPDWNPALFYSQNYICHLAAFRLSMAVGVGGFRAEFDGAQDWDLFLRLLAGVPAEAIRHIPHVLYHWRTSEASTALSADAKPYALTAATRALRDRLAADGIEADVETVRGRYQRVRYHLPADPPPVTVVIPTTGDVALLGPCLDGLLHGTDYPKLTILLALSARTMTGSGTRAYVEEAAADPRVRLLIDEDGTFNYSRVNNRAVSAADDDLICFLNDDTEPIDRDWLSSMVGHLLQDRVGAVGAKLYYPQGSIQHGGVVLGLGGVAGHLHTRLGRDAGRILRPRQPRSGSFLRHRRLHADQEIGVRGGRRLRRGAGDRVQRRGPLHPHPCCWLADRVDAVGRALPSRIHLGRTARLAGTGQGVRTRGRPGEEAVGRESWTSIRITARTCHSSISGSSRFHPGFRIRGVNSGARQDIDLAEEISSPSHSLWIQRE